jgi:hypothetical protein
VPPHRRTNSWEQNDRERIGPTTITPLQNAWRGPFSAANRVGDGGDRDGRRTAGSALRDLLRVCGTFSTARAHWSRTTGSTAARRLSSASAVHLESGAGARPATPAEPHDPALTRKSAVSMPGGS